MAATLQMERNLPVTLQTTAVLHVIIPLGARYLTFTADEDFFTETNDVADGGTPVPANQLKLVPGTAEEVFPFMAKFEDGARGDDLSRTIRLTGSINSQTVWLRPSFYSPRRARR